VIARASAEARNSNACHDGAFANTIRAHDGLQRLPRASGGAHPARAQNGRPHRRRRLSRAQPHRTTRRRRPRRAHRRARRRAAAHGWTQDPLLQGRPDAAHRGRAHRRDPRGRGVDTFLHLAFLASPTHASAWAHELESVGTMHVLNACRERPVHKFILWSQTILYGAHPSNPNFFPESHPLRGNKESRFLTRQDRSRAGRSRFAKQMPGRPW
jgi:nucleoside-diphosphate-sugar epimerase